MKATVDRLWLWAEHDLSAETLCGMTSKDLLELQATFDESRSQLLKVLTPPAPIPTSSPIKNFLFLVEAVGSELTAVRAYADELNAEIDLLNRRLTQKGVTVSTQVDKVGDVSTAKVDVFGADSDAVSRVAKAVKTIAQTPADESTVCNTVEEFEILKTWRGIRAAFGDCISPGEFARGLKSAFARPNAPTEGERVSAAANGLPSRPFSDDPDVGAPSHYGGADDPYEAVKVIEAWGLGFNLGSALKYLCRAGRKAGSTRLQDLKKALWYVDREVGLEDE